MKSGGPSGGVASAGARSMAGPWVHFTRAGIAQATEHGDAVFSAQNGAAVMGVLT
jgi:hypothetical protein